MATPGWIPFGLHLSLLLLLLLLLLVLLLLLLLILLFLGIRVRFEFWLILWHRLPETLLMLAARDDEAIFIG